jgi:ADP-heptose:LPS heptosyltransferase
VTVLALRALGLGDLLTAFPALRALGRAFPSERLVLAAPVGLAALAHLCGVVDEVLDTAPLAPLPEDLRGRIGVAVNLHGRGPESHRCLIELAPARVIAFRHPAVPESAGGPEWRADEHEVLRWCRLLEWHGIAADPAELDLEVPPGPVPREARGATVIHPGAAHAARRWPASRWAEVARAERERGRHVVITGGPGERILAREVAVRAGLPDQVVYAGRTDLIELARLVSVAGRVVCGDTGVAHLATALRTPSVLLFGPTAPDRWGPPPNRPWHRVLWPGTTGAPNGSRVDPALLRIHPPAVTAALDALATLEKVA